LLSRAADDSDTMTLEEYRIQVIERLKARQDPVKARGLLAEVELVLTNSRIGDRAQKTFWETLNTISISSHRNQHYSWKSNRNGAECRGRRRASRDRAIPINDRER
jgi:hypothetical protein